jgi:serine/threonine protein phosphatase PrpC
MSKDFRPSREKERIAARKGYVTNDGRLLGLISVSRSFGDWKYKDPKQKDVLRKAISGKTVDFEEYLISNRAEFRILDYDPRIDKYIIIVSDGIFQHAPNSNVIFDTINKYLAMEKSEYSSLKNVPNVTDNIRLDLINNIYGDFNTKGKADNMTLILIHLQNDKCLQNDK